MVVFVEVHAITHVAITAAENIRINLIRLIFLLFEILIFVLLIAYLKLFNNYQAYDDIMHIYI